MSPAPVHIPPIETAASDLFSRDRQIVKEYFFYKG
jgi:hypothetical protein